MFIAIIIPEARASIRMTVIIMLAILISCMIYYIPFFDFISDGFAIIICAVIASAVGALAFPVKEENGGGH
jgi:hypothetical protein